MSARQVDPGEVVEALKDQVGDLSVRLAVTQAALKAAEAENAELQRRLEQLMEAAEVER